MTSKPAAVPLFSTFGKGTNDLLTKGFPTTYKAEVTTKAENGVNFVTSFERDNDKLVGTFQPKYKLDKYGLEFTGTIDTSNTFKGDLSVDNLLPGLKTIFKGATALDEQSVEAGFEYKHEFGTATGSFLWKKGKTTLGASATVGRQALTAGVSTKYSVDSSSLVFVSGGLNYKAPSHDISAFVKREEKSGKSEIVLGGSVLYTAGKEATFASTVEYDLQQAPAAAIKVKFGGSYNLDADTTGKARFDTEGKLALAVARQLNPSLKATLGAELNTFELQSNKHKYGFAFELKA
jgi:hypothetical protein